jgi:hypothetical protein
MQPARPSACRTLARGSAANRPASGPLRLVLEGQVIEQLDQDQVLEHIGMIAGVRGMAVAQHVRPVCRAHASLAGS